MTHMAALIPAFAAATALSAPPQAAAAQGIRYNVRPSAAWTQWDDALGLEDARFLGGAAGIGFGSRVDLTGFYLFSEDRPTNLSSLPFATRRGSTPQDQLFDIESYGGELSIGLTGGSWAPVLMGGGGILRFRPERGDDVRRVQLKYGAGFRGLVAETLEAEVMVERSRHYLDPLELAAPPSAGAPPLPVDPGAGDLRRNLTMRLGLGFQLGRRESGRAFARNRAMNDGFSDPSSDLAFALEPFGGRQTFDASLEIADQTVAGVRGGFDLGPFVGLRGFYWRGVNDDYDAFGEIEGYGGEAQFSLGGRTAFSPHLLAGGGRIRFGADFDGGADGVPANRTALIVGGGVDLGLGSRVRLSAGARDYITSGPDDDGALNLGELKDPKDLVHNWQMSLGLRILVGGDGGGRGEWDDMGPGARAPGGPAPDAWTPPAQTAAAARPRAPAPPRAQAWPDTATAEAATPPGDPAPPPVPSVVVIHIAPPSQDARTPALDSLAPPDSLALSAAGISPEELRDILREEIALAIVGDSLQVVAPAAATVRPDAVTRADIAAMESRLADRMESRLDAIERQLREAARAPTPAVDTLEAGPADPEPEAGEAAAPATEDPDAWQGRLAPSLGFPEREIRPYTGIQFGGGTQWVVGVAADLGASDALGSFDVVPEASLAVGQRKPTWMAAVNLQYRPSWVFEREDFWVGPVASLGLGLLNQDGSQIVLNTMWGVNVQVRRDGWDGEDPVNLFVAHQGIDLFQRTRILAGISLGR